VEERLSHPEEAEQFYRAWAAAGERVRVGMEASGHARWFERLLGELWFELWVGDAAEIQSKRARKQKTDRQDAQLILKLMLKDDFPRIWVPSWENRDLRQRSPMLNHAGQIAGGANRNSKSKRTAVAMPDGLLGMIMAQRGGAGRGFRVSRAGNNFP
jgi:transposase